MKSLDNLIECFEKLPGIGHRTAERLAFSILNQDIYEVNKFSQSLLDVKNKIKKCPNCGIYLDEKVCDICNDPERDQSTLIVVSSYKDAMAIENVTKKYKYFILNGNISLLRNVTPEKLNIDVLQNRIQKENIKELILATDSTLDGETTARYLSNIFKNIVNVTRIAYGLPMDSELDYLDTLTIERAIKGRNKI